MIPVERALQYPIERWARADPDRPAVLGEGERWTYERLCAEVDRWETFFASGQVVAKSRVALLARNHPRFVAQLFALGRLKAAAVPLNVRLTASELGHQLERIRPKLCVAQSELGEKLLGSHPWVAAEEVERAPRVEGIRSSRSLETDAVCAFLFTSGTTGVPKAAALTWANFVAGAWASAQNLGETRGQRWLATLPFFHVGGVAMVTRCILGGGTLIVASKFDAAFVNEAIDRLGATHVSLVANTLARTVEARAGRPFPATFAAALVGGGPVPSAALARARSLGAAVLQTYGLTEACSQVATERPADADGETAGPPLPGVEVRVADEAGRPRLPGEVGEVCVRAATVMQGYWGDPVATREAFSGGWLRTRDLGRLDERGRLQILARRQDLIVSGGENVYPAEVEAVLGEHPAVAQVAVVPKADATWGQAPAALLVLSGPASRADLVHWCRSGLAGFKVPQLFVPVPSLPRTESGKVDRTAALELLDTGEPLP